jgi:hypothetical protein
MSGSVSFQVHGRLYLAHPQLFRLYKCDPKAYTPPWNQLDALAGAYAKRGDKADAIRYYTLSLQENPGNDQAKQKLKELGARPTPSTKENRH